MDVEGLVSCPMILLLHEHLHLDSLPLGALGQSCPVIGIGLYIASTTNDFFASSRESGYNIIGFAVHLKGERRYVDGYGDINVVRIDVGKLIRLAEVLRNIVSAGSQQQRNYAAKK